MSIKLDPCFIFDVCLIVDHSILQQKKEPKNSVRSSAQVKKCLSKKAFTVVEFSPKSKLAFLMSTFA